MYDTLQRTNGQLNIFINNAYNNYEMIRYSEDGRRVRISGWGLTETNDLSSRLRRGRMQFRRQRLFTMLDPRMIPNPTNIEMPIDWRILVGRARHGSWGCAGDSGGKL